MPVMMKHQNWSREKQKYKMKNYEGMINFVELTLHQNQ